MFQPFMVPMRVLMLLGGGLLAVFGSEAIELGGAGPLAVVAAAFISCYFWQKQGWEVDDVSVYAYNSQGKKAKNYLYDYFHLGNFFIINLSRRISTSSRGKISLRLIFAPSS